MIPRHVILLGAPGAGKGTQAAMLSRALGIPHVASGDLFRDNLRRKTELGLRAQSYMDAGQLVPDEVTVSMVEARLSEPDCRSGAVLDGFPRNVAQAQALDRMLGSRGARIRKVLYIEVPEQELVRRLSGRFVCRQCQGTYHTVFSPPKRVGICDSCGGELYQRSDDAPETVSQRLQVYLEQTAPLIAFYEGKGLLRRVNGAESIDAVQQSLVCALGGGERAE